MKILFWGPVTLQLFHFDVKNAKLAKKIFLSACARLGAASKKRIST
jgi:hypothetical protein